MDKAFPDLGERISQLTAICTNNVADMVLEVSVEELIEADRYEPENYHRAKVTLGSGNEAWLYLADPPDGRIQ